MMLFDQFSVTYEFVTGTQSVYAGNEALQLITETTPPPFWPGTDCKQRADIHSRGQLSDCPHEGGEGGPGALCWSLYHDEPTHF